MLISPNLITEQEITEETQIQTIYTETLAVRAPTIPEFDKKQLVLDELREEVALYDWNTEIMLKIAFCESSYNPNAVNWKDAEITGMPSLGIFQINAVYDEKLFNIKYNVAQAFQKFKTQYYWAWKNCYQKII